MKKIVFFILLLLAVSGFSQKFDDKEKALILSGDINKPMTIYNVENEQERQVLLSQSQEISPKTKILKILLERMRLSLASTDGGVGIAAPQVGINRRVVLVQRFDKKNFPIDYFINPKIIWKSDVLLKGPEGDLSINNFRDQFYRSYSIRLEYYDLDNQRHDEMIEGFTAVICQHEIDHLSGILISDKLEKDKSNRYNEIKLYKIPSSESK